MHQVCSCVCVRVCPTAVWCRTQTPGKARCNLTSRLVFFSLPPFPSFCPLPFSFSSLFAEELRAAAAVAAALPGCVGGWFQPAWLVLEFGALRSAAVSRRLSAHTHTHSGTTSSHTRSLSALSLSICLSLFLLLSEYGPPGAWGSAVAACRPCLISHTHTRAQY